MPDPQKHHVGARAAKADREKLDYIRPGLFGLPEPPDGEPADPLFSLVGSMYGRRLLVRSDIPAAAEWLDEQDTGARAGVKITERYDLPHSPVDGVEADVPLGKFQLTDRIPEPMWETPDVYPVDSRSAEIEGDQLEPVSPRAFGLYKPEVTVPADPVFTVVGSMFSDVLYVRCDVPLVSKWVERKDETDDDVEITKRYKLPYRKSGAIGVEAEIPRRHLHLTDHCSKRMSWENVVGVRKTK